MPGLPRRPCSSTDRKPSSSTGRATDAFVAPVSWFMVVLPLGTMSDLAPRAAYDRWAATYAVEGRNPLTDLAADLVRAHLPAVSGLRIGDLGCGTGRWLLALDQLGAEAIGIDLSGPMLAAAKAAGCLRLAAGILTALPLASESLDGALLVLSLSHEPDRIGALQELARVLNPGGWALIVDLHASAADRGWKRSFRDAAGESRRVRWHAHDEPRLRRAAAISGLQVECWHEASLDASRLPAGAPETASTGAALYALRLRRWP